MNLKEQVMEVDRLFCRDCKVGKEKAWASYFMENGKMITQGTKENVVGKEAIEKAVSAMFALPDVDFYWEPEECEVSGDGSLAVTRGRSKLTYRKDGELVTKYGNYTTVWRKRNGKWKISWDIGN